MKEWFHTTYPKEAVKSLKAEQDCIEQLRQLAKLSNLSIEEIYILAVNLTIKYIYKEGINE